MKIIKTETQGSGNTVSRIELEEGESVIREWFFYHYEKQNGTLFGELVIPEGICVIEKRAFVHLGVSYCLYRLPGSLKKLGENVFYYEVKLIYPGSSEEFKKLATVREESVYESYGYDRSPYYSGGSSWVTRYHCFDSSSNSIEVLCESDGVTLLYGKRHRRDNEEPKVNE